MNDHLDVSEDTERLRGAVNAHDWGLVVNLCQLMTMNWGMGDEESLVCAGIILGTEGPQENKPVDRADQLAIKAVWEAERTDLEAENTRLRAELDHVEVVLTNLLSLDEYWWKNVPESTKVILTEARNRAEETLAKSRPMQTQAVTVTPATKQHLIDEHGLTEDDFQGDHK